MANDQKVLVTTYVPQFESERGAEMRVGAYFDVLNGKEEPVTGEEHLLAQAREFFGESPEFSNYSDQCYTTTFLDPAGIPEDGYDSVLMVNHLANFATGLGTLLGQTHVPRKDAMELVGKSVGIGLANLRKKNVSVYVAEWIGFGSYSPLGAVAFPEEEGIGKKPEQAYEKILGDAGFRVEEVSRFDFSDGALERNDSHGEYILLKAVPA